MRNRIFQYRHIFFDLDGTLLDTQHDLRWGWRKVMEDKRLSVPDFDRLFRIGPQAPDMARILFPELSEAELKEVVGAFVSCYDYSGHSRTRPYPWIDKFLRELKAGGAKLYVMTNKRKYPTAYLMEKSGWQELFSGLFTPDMYGDRVYSKSELLGKTLKDLAIAPETAIMIGDTRGDITAGKLNNIAAAGVLWGYGGKEELTESDYLLSEKDFE